MQCSAVGEGSLQNVISTQWLLALPSSSPVTSLSRLSPPQDWLMTHQAVQGALRAHHPVNWLQSWLTLSSMGSKKQSWRQVETAESLVSSRRPRRPRIADRDFPLLGKVWWHRPCDCSDAPSPEEACANLIPWAKWQDFSWCEWLISLPHRPTGGLLDPLDWWLRLCSSGLCPVAKVTRC